MPKKETLVHRKYDDAHCKRVSFKFNLRTDADILARLAEAESMQGYIKELIRADIARRDAGKEPECLR